jgi:hypothetical protein
MAMQKYCVYNQTRESFLSLGVTAAEPTAEHANVLQQHLPITADAGLWLKPYKGISSPSGLPPFDLLYLDDNYHVIRAVEYYSAATAAPVEPGVTSALALPLHTIYASHTHPGDQLVVSAAEEMEERFAPQQKSGFTQVPQTMPVGSHPKAVSVEGDGSTAVNRSRQMQQALQRLDERDKAEQEVEEDEVSFFGRFLRWLSSDRRRSRRHPLPGLVAYYWTGGAPQAFHIGDISTHGLFLLTDERWFPGTLILMTLQRVDTSGDDPGDTIPVQTKVVRWDDDGVGLSFLPARASQSRTADGWSNRGADQRMLEKFLDGLNLPEMDKRRIARR